MDDLPTANEIQKDLIKIDSELPSFKNNSKATSALQDFVINPYVNRVCLNCDKPLMLKALVEFVKKTSKFPFIHFNAINLGSIEDALRKSVLLCIKSSRDVYEGEILGIKQIKDENGILQYIEMTLKSLKSTKTITLSKNLINLVNDVNMGDVVYIEPNIGIVKRIGRSETRINEYDLEGDKHVQLLKGGVHSTREKDIYVSIYDLDYAFNKYNENISDFTRNHVDRTVEDYLKQGIAQLVCSGVYIENTSMLSTKDFKKILAFYNVYPHLKILLDNVYSDILDSSFLFVKSVEEEKVFSVFEYFLKRTLSEELKAAVEEVLTFDNYEAVLAVLAVSSTEGEFRELFDYENLKNRLEVETM